MNAQYRKIAIYSICNVLIWYSFTLFMPFFLIISNEFFPKADKLLNMIVGFAVFGVGLLTRPIGSYIFGRIGDTICREKAVGYSIILLSLSTIAIGIIPSYNSIGFFSAILLTIARACQGIAMGGAGNVTLVQLVEAVPDNRKGVAGCLPNAANLAGLFVSNLLFSAMYSSSVLNDGVMWRIPFICAALLIPFAVFQFRLSSCTHEKIANLSNTAMKDYKLEIFCVFLLTAFSATCYYSVFAFLPNYMLMHFGGESVVYITYLNIILFGIIFFCGFIADKFGCYPVLISVTAFVVISSIGMLLIKDSCLAAKIMVVCLGCSICSYYGVSGAFFISIIPKEIRCTSIALPMSISQAVFGGFVPVLFAKLTSFSFSLIILPIVMIAGLALSIVIWVKKKHG